METKGLFGIETVEGLGIICRVGLATLLKGPQSKYFKLCRPGCKFKDMIKFNVSTYITILNITFKKIKSILGSWAIQTRGGARFAPLVVVRQLLV